MTQEEVIKNIANTRERLAELLEQAKTFLPVRVGDLVTNKRGKYPHFGKHLIVTYVAVADCGSHAVAINVAKRKADGTASGTILYGQSPDKWEVVNGTN